MPFLVYYVQTSGPEAMGMSQNVVLGRSAFPTLVEAQSSIPEAVESMKRFGQPVSEFQIIEAEHAASALSQVTGMPLPPDAPQG